jgi:hypothetical protein
MSLRVTPYDIEFVELWRKWLVHDIRDICKSYVPPDLEELTTLYSTLVCMKQKR